MGYITREQTDPQYITREPAAQEKHYSGLHNFVAGAINPYISAANFTKKYAIEPAIKGLTGGDVKLPHISQIHNDEGWQKFVGGLIGSIAPFGRGIKVASTIGKAARTAIPFLKKTPRVIQGAINLGAGSAGAEAVTAEDEKNRLNAAGLLADIVGAKKLTIESRNINVDMSSEELLKGMDLL